MKKRLKNLLGIALMALAAVCLLYAFTLQNQDLRSVADLSIFAPQELQEVYYTAENVEILACYGVRIEESATVEDLDFGPEYSYYPADDYPEPGRFGGTERKLRDTYYLIEVEMVDGAHTAVMSVEDNDGPAFEAGDVIALCGWVSTMRVTDNADFAALKEAALAEISDAAPEAAFTLYYRGETVEEVAEMKADENQSNRTVFMIFGAVLLVAGAFLRDKKYKDTDDMPRFG